MIKRDLEPAGLRFGGTSWVTPGTFADNLRYLSNDVSDMEIVLFDTPEHSNMPTDERLLPRFREAKEGRSVPEDD